MNNIENKITWIASYPRSGNTWVRALITAYANNGEVDINSIMQTSDKNPEYFTDIIKKPIHDWTMTDQALVKPAALLKLLEDAGGNLILKTHDCNFDVSGVAQIPYDLTRVGIYIVRDPRDVALSFKNHYGCKNNAEAVDKLLDDKFMTRFPNQGLFVPQLSWKIHFASWMRELPYPVYALRYEDLLAKPIEIFREIIQFLQMDYDEELARKTIDACSFDNMQKQEKQDGFRETVGQTFFHKGQAQRWKTELEPELQNKIVSAFRAEMSSVGYL